MPLQDAAVVLQLSHHTHPCLSLGRCQVRSRPKSQQINPSTQYARSQLHPTYPSLGKPQSPHGQAFTRVGIIQVSCPQVTHLPCMCQGTSPSCKPALYKPCTTYTRPQCEVSGRPCSQVWHLHTTVHRISLCGSGAMEGHLAQRVCAGLDFSSARQLCGPHPVSAPVLVPLPLVPLPLSPSLRAGVT